MKYLVLLTVLFGQMAWPQIQAGTVTFLDFEQGEITMSADSRTTYQAGGHADTQCKLSAFGDKFAFSMAGLTKRDDPKTGWDARLIARKIWESESLHESDAAKLVRAVSDKWIAETRKIYNDPAIFRYRRLASPNSNIIGNASFAATDKNEKLFVRLINVSFDVMAFDSTGDIRLDYLSRDLSPGEWISGGLSQIVGEFMLSSTPRATEFMNWWFPQISKLDPSARRAALALKVIELSILLHPRHEELGFPVDVLQIKSGTGIRWIANEKKCPEK